jgi:hypothetical protein
LRWGRGPAEEDAGRDFRKYVEGSHVHFPFGASA